MQYAHADQHAAADDLKPLPCEDPQFWSCSKITVLSLPCGALQRYLHMKDTQPAATLYDSEGRQTARKGSQQSSLQVNLAKAALPEPLQGTPVTQ
jgi:hypothetical protein